MKRFICTMLLAGTLLATGCVNQYYEKLDELQERVEELQRICDKLNGDLSALRNLVTALEKQDMVTGITELRSGSTVTGYRINFVEHDPVTITNGSDGKKPLVSSRQDPDDKNWYWAVQYGDGEVQWLLAPDGSKMLSIGILPYIAIRDGWFCYTLDGTEWIQLGEANGKNGDQMFQSVNTSFDDYVIITLTNGSQFKFPLYRKYLDLQTEYGKINDNADAQSRLLLSYIEKLLYITRISPILSGKDTVGLSVSLSNGNSFRIHDWTASVSPAIFIKKDTDGKFYWAYTIGNSPEHWVLSPDGEKMSASSEEVSVPQVSVVRDTDGQYYWAVTTGDNTELLRFKVDEARTPRAIDSVSQGFLFGKELSGFPGHRAQGFDDPVQSAQAVYRVPHDGTGNSGHWVPVHEERVVCPAYVRGQRSHAFCSPGHARWLYRLDGHPVRFELYPHQGAIFFHGPFRKNHGLLHIYHEECSRHGHQDHPHHPGGLIHEEALFTHPPALPAPPGRLFQRD